MDTATYEVWVGVGNTAAETTPPVIMTLEQAVTLWKKLAHAVEESYAPVHFVLRVRGPGGVLRLSVLPGGQRDAALIDLDPQATAIIEREYPGAVAQWWRKQVAAAAIGAHAELDLVEAFAGRKGHVPDGAAAPALAAPQNTARLKKLVHLFSDCVSRATPRYNIGEVEI